MSQLPYKKITIWSVFFLLIVLILGFIVGPKMIIDRYDMAKILLGVSASSTEQLPNRNDLTTQKEFIVTHVSTPKPVKGIYMTACAASMPSFRNDLVKLIDKTELNSVIIDIKDYSGTVSFDTGNSELDSNPGMGCRVKDMKEFVGTLHEKNIYVIGRITVFQDPHLTKLDPEIAIKKSTDKSALWKDKKGISYVDPGSKKMWQRISNLAEASYKTGFDEINFDYIRFPSDGNMKDIYYPFSEEKVLKDPIGGKAAVLRSFFEYLGNSMKEKNIPISADLFGMTTTNTDDLNIGQILEDALANFDFVCPMVYPSHYPPGFNGWKNVNAVPYEIVKFSMDSAVKRAEAATTTPFKLRPWLQDNNYPVVYTPEMVKAQIKATYDSGLDSWMLWNAANRYTLAALELNSTSTEIMGR